MSTLPKLSGLLSWLLPKSRLAELQMPGSAQLPKTHSCSHTGDKSLLGAEVRAFPRNLSGAITHRHNSAPRKDRPPGSITYVTKRCHRELQENPTASPIQ